MKFFVKDFCKTVQARVVYIDKQVYNDGLYRGTANQLSHAYSSQYLSNFFHTLNNEFLYPSFEKVGIYWFTSVCSSVQPSAPLSVCIIYTPALKKWGIYWFTSVRLSIHPSVRPSAVP